MDNTIIIIMFLIFAGAAVLSTAALYARQSVLVAYIVLGMILGPGMKLIYESDLVSQTGDVGVIFLLFLLGRLIVTPIQERLYGDFSSFEGRGRPPGAPPDIIHARFLKFRIHINM